MRTQRSVLTWRGLLTVVSVGLLLPACGAPATPDDTTSEVVVSAAVPDVALPGATVTLLGEGFTQALTLRVDGMSVPANVESAFRLTFTVPDTPGYPRIELGDTGADRLLFVGAAYDGERIAAGVQAALDALPPGVALRLPPGTYAGAFLALDRRWLFGSGAHDAGTVLVLGDSAWFQTGSGLAELALAARQYVVVETLPDDPETPFGTLRAGVGAGSGAAPHASWRTSAAPDPLPTVVRDARLEIGAQGVPGASMPSFSVFEETDRFVLERVEMDVDAPFTTIRAREVVLRDAVVRVADVYVEARYSMDIAATSVHAAGRQEYYVDDPLRMVFRAVDFRAGSDVDIGSGGVGDTPVVLTDLRIEARDVYIDPTQSLFGTRLTIKAERNVVVESSAFDLTLTDASLTASAIALLADNGSVRMASVELVSDDAGADDPLLPPGAVLVRAWTDLDVMDTQVRGVSAEFTCETGAVTVTGSQIAVEVELDIEADGPISVRSSSLRGGSIDIEAGGTGFELRGVDLFANLGGMISSPSGLGLVEDAVLTIRSSNTFTLASDVALTLRRVHFVFAFGLVLEAPPGALVLEDVTGADDAETPGQP